MKLKYLLFGVANFGWVQSFYSREVSCLSSYISAGRCRDRYCRLSVTTQHPDMNVILLSYDSKYCVEFGVSVLHRRFSNGV